MSAPIGVEIVASFPDIMGDTPTYDAANRRLLWVDTARGQVHEVIWDKDSKRQLGRTWQVGSWATAVVPRASGGFVVATNRDIVAVSEDGTSTLLGFLPSNERRPRWKDLNCDPQGRLIGAWVPDDHRGAGELVRLEADGTFVTVLSGVTLATGVDWSPDGSTLYLSDSYAGTVDAFDYDSVGSVKNRRTSIKIEPGAGVPDGLAVDVEGCIWLAVPWSSETRRYSPSGELLTTVHMPTATPIGCAFGGPDGNELFITSSWLKTPLAVLKRAGVSDERIEAALHDSVGGALFVCRPGMSGPPATAFAG